MKTCCAFGRRNVYENIIPHFEDALSLIIKQGCTVFYTGNRGRFDNIFSTAVRSQKYNCPVIKLIRAEPYMTKKINEGGEYLYSLYDDIIIPSSIVSIHYKSVITARNKRIIDHSETVLFYLRGIMVRRIMLNNTPKKSQAAYLYIKTAVTIPVTAKKCNEVINFIISKKPIIRHISFYLIYYIHFSI